MLTVRLIPPPSAPSPLHRAAIFVFCATTDTDWTGRFAVFLVALIVAMLPRTVLDCFESVGLDHHRCCCHIEGDGCIHAYVISTTTVITFNFRANPSYSSRFLGTQAPLTIT